jgi:C1A family cysteine protease
MSRLHSMGWQRDLPDFRDFSPKHKDIAPLLKGMRANAPKAALPAKIDLSKWCSPIEDQGDLGSCTAQAGVGLMEYFENRAFGRYLDASRLFLYKATRNLLGWTGDTGAWLRTTMKAMVVFGVPPEQYWSYDISRYDEEPTAFLYSFAQSYKSLKYYRLDSLDLSTADLLIRVRQHLAAGHPSMFGFTVYNFGNEDGEFEYPTPTAKVQGGHAVVAIGYDDARSIAGSKGALKIRNSWGTGWGQDGYGWLPYKYVEEGLAVDFWSLFKQEYVDSGKFD